MDSRPPTRSVPSRGNLRHHSVRSREGHHGRLPLASRRSRRTWPTSTPPATTASTSTSTDAARRHGVGRRLRAPRSPPSVTPRARSAPTARPSTPTSRPPPRPATASSTRRSPRSRRRAWTSSKPRWAAVMGLFDALDASGSALSAERAAHGRHRREPRQRAVHARPTASRTAARRSSSRRPAPASARELRRLRCGAARGVKVAGIVEDQTPVAPRLRPGHPDADEQGYVVVPNVNTVTEMIDLIAASRAYEANVTAMQTTKYDVRPDAGHPRDCRSIPACSTSRRRVERRLGRRLRRRRRRRGHLGRRLGFGSVLADQLGSSRAPRTTPPRVPGAGHRPGHGPGGGRHGRRARPAVDAARLDSCAPRPSRPSTTSSTHRSRSTVSALMAMSPRAAARRSSSRRSASRRRLHALPLASAPSYTTLQAGVDPAKTGKITAALDQAGVSYELRTTAPPSRYLRPGAEARVALAGQGLAAGGAQPGYELSTSRSSAPPPSSSRSPTSAPSRARSPRPSGRSTASRGAQVQLDAAQGRPLRRRGQPATAAVLLSAAPPLDPPPSAASPARLLQRADLKAANVTITDASGSMLWPSATAPARGHADQPARRAAVRDAVPAQLDAMLARRSAPTRPRPACTPTSTSTSRRSSR